MLKNKKNQKEKIKKTKIMSFGGAKQNTTKKTKEKGLRQVFSKKKQNVRKGPFCLDCIYLTYRSIIIPNYQNNCKYFCDLGVI